MQKKHIYLSALIVPCLFIIDLVTNSAFTSTPGAPSGKTGSPGDGFATCTSCHAGTATSQAGLITSDIPPTGYWPGTTYNITSTISSLTSVKFGFEISPQNPAGAKLGTLIITNSTETQLVGSSKYLTHKTAGTSAPSGTKTWTFNWKAPTIGTGAVTFYGAFNASNSNAASSGDQIILSTLTVQEDLSAGIASPADAVRELKVFPNPSGGNVFVSFTTEETAASVTVFDLSGKMVLNKNLAGIFPGENTVVLNGDELSRGIYFVSVKTGSETFNGKIIKQ